MSLVNFNKKGAGKAPFFSWNLLLLIISFTILSCQVYKDPIDQLNNNTSRTTFRTVKKVIDGDSIELENGEKVRYKGINAPEKNQYLYKDALTFNASLVSGKKVRIEFDNEPKDQYGRTLGYVFVNQLLVNQEIIKAGLAFLYNESKIGKYKNLFLKSIKEAQLSHRGLWQKSLFSLKIVTIKANASGEDTNNVNGEWVEIRNYGLKLIHLSNFILQDESNNQYFFPIIDLPSNSVVRVFSGSGRNGREDLYWGSIHPIWNNDSDCAYLFDNQNKLVDFRSYP